MPAVLLVRHAQASFGAADYDRLSALGERQAAIVGAELAARGVAVERITTGTLARQRRTAELIADALGCGVAEDGRWDEYEPHAILARHTAAELADGPAIPPGTMSSREYQRLLDDGLAAWTRDAAATGGGSWAAFRTRMGAALDDAFAAADGGPAVVVTSAGAIAAVCATVLPGAEPGFVALNRVAINASVTKLVRGRSGTSLVSFNDHAHLERVDAALVTYR